MPALNSLDPSSLFDGDADPLLKRQLRRLRAWAVAGVLAWMALVAVATEWRARMVIESEVAAVAARTEQYRESAASLFGQIYVELDKMTSILATQGYLASVAGRYSNMGEAFSALPVAERVRRLKADPETKRASQALADIVASLRYDLIYVLDRNGIVVASSDFGQAVSILGQYYGDRAYFRDAMANGAGRMFVVQRVTGVPGFFFSARLGAAGSELGAVVARQPSDSFVTLLSRRRFEFAIVDDGGMVVSSSNPEYRLRHVVDPGHPPPSAAQLRDIYQLDTARPIEVVRPASPLNDAHWQVNGEPRLLSVKRMGETQYRLAIVSRFDEVDQIRRNHRVFGALLALFGLPAAAAILAMLAGHARQRAAARQLASANERLAAANEDKNRYLGIAAHDLRNPLSSVRGLSQLMLEMPMPPEQQRELVSTVYRTSDEMLGLVNDLLDVARIESGRIDLNLAPCDVADLVAQRLQHLRPHAERKRIGLRFEAVDAMAVIDKARFGQVIDNLVSNAIKFSPIGSTVRILLENADGSVRLVVEDEGPGFSEADRAGLFKNFQKLSARPTGGESSTGLGLSIAKKVVDTHGGAIAVEGAAGGGARFVVTIPAGGPPAKEGNHG